MTSSPERREDEHAETPHQPPSRGANVPVERVSLDAPGALSPTRVESFSEVLALRCTSDARIRAIRWDVIPWAMVLDLEWNEHERRDSRVRRVWLAFVGVSDTTWPFDRARTPTGWHSQSEIDVSEPQGRFRTFSFSVQNSCFIGNEVDYTKPGGGRVEVKAMSILAVASVEEHEAMEVGLSYEQLQSLATDDDLRQALLATGRT